MSRSFIQFPPDFLFGVATASYQIEGAYQEDGRGESIWDRFSHTPGKTLGGHTGDVACDHYHRYPDDIALMKNLGIPAYRLSVAWPRIFPEKGVFNQKGVDFYRRVLDNLHEAGIDPSVTLYHWDLPQWLEDAGGWVNRDTVDYFAEYAARMYDELGDLTPRFITHNEPWCTAFLGYGMGEHAPGHKNWREAFLASHHVLLSHGLATQAYRASGQKGEVGITLNFSWVDAASDAPEDLAAARRLDGFSNRWFLDPLFSGQYPADMVEWVDPIIGGFDCVKPGDLQIIGAPVDFLGINFYTRSKVAAGPNDGGLNISYIDPPAETKTAMGWEVHANSLYRLLSWIEKDYTHGLPLYITENGAAFDDVMEQGEVHDERRLAYVADHLAAAKQFIDEGGSLKGYFLWSFMDNFEWAYGYSKRFGVIHVDYDTQVRTPKDSAKWYSEQIAFNRTVENVK